MTRSLYFTIMTTLILSACSRQATLIAPQQASSPTASPTLQAQTPVITTAVPTVAHPLTNTPISPTLSPTNQPECTDAASFVSDVSIPDNTDINQGTAYTKTWRISNKGTCAWNSDYSLVFASGEKSGAPDSLPLTYTVPGASLDISVNLTAPLQGGIVSTFFEIHNPDGERIKIDSGIYLYVTINISANAASTGLDSTTTQPEATASIGSSTSVPDSVCAYTTDPSKTAEAISAINNYRAQNGLTALSVNSLLTQAAKSHAADMACNTLFYHNGSDGSSPVSRVAAIGYRAAGVTENVYGSYPPLNGQDVVAWWANDQLDPRHNENLLSTKYTEIGVAYTFFNNFGYYVVDFAASRNN